jgi:MFS family permease
MRTLVGGNVMTLLVSMSLYGGALMMSVYAQQVLGWSAVLFGLSTAIYAAMSIVGSNLAGPLTTRFGYRKVAILGAAMLAIGAFLLSRVTADGNYWTDLLPAMVVFGYGIGTTVVAAAIAALSTVPAEDSGLASGINNSVFQIGAALGIALCTTVASAFTDPSPVDARLGLHEGVQAGFGAAFVAAICCVLVAFVLTALRERSATAEQPATTRPGAMS